MQMTNTIWHNGKFVPWEAATTHVLTHGLHYGSGIFEGIRVYETDNGSAIFRLDDHIKRFFYSANALKMTLSYSVEALTQATVELLRKTKLTVGYIRPIAFYNADTFGINPKGAKTDIAILCWAWGKYLPKGTLAIKTSSYIRIHPKSTIADAKISGHYVNSIVALQETNDTHYNDVLLLDADGNVAESSGANVFIVKDNTLFTPPPGSILPGITRQTVLEDIAPMCNLEAIEKTLTRDDIYTADEAFLCGTAAEITPFHSLDDKLIGNGKTGAMSQRLVGIYDDMVHGKLPEFNKHLTVV